MSEIQFQHIQPVDNGQQFASAIDQGHIGKLFDFLINEGPGMVGRGIGKCLDAAAAVHDTCVAGVSGVISGVKDIAPSLSRERSEPAIEPVRQQEVAQTVQQSCHVDMCDIGTFAPPPLPTNVGRSVGGIG